MCHYTYFATEERKALKAQEMHIQAIAKELERVSSSVSREFWKNAMPTVITQHIMEINDTASSERTAVKRQNYWMMQS